MTIAVASTPAPEVAPVRPRKSAAHILALEHAVPALAAHQRALPEPLHIAIAQGSAVGIVGDARAGKSLLVRILLGRTELAQGTRRWHGQVVTHVRGAGAQRAGLPLQLVSGDAGTILNPAMRIVDSVAEAALQTGAIRRRQTVEYVALQLNRVGIDPMQMRRFPHELAPAQRLRVALARALAANPELVACDAPTASLDVTGQAQFLNALLEVQALLGFTLLLTGRDIDVVAHVTERLVVMHGGVIMEDGPGADLLTVPAHPCTRALLDARTIRRRADVAPLVRREPDQGPWQTRGCIYRHRCVHAAPACRELAPPLVEIAPGHALACHLQPARR